MDWGSFLLGCVFSGILFFFLGISFGSLMRLRYWDNPPVVLDINQIVSEIEKGEGLMGSFEIFRTKDKDDEGDLQESEPKPLMDLNRN